MKKTKKSERVFRYISAAICLAILLGCAWLFAGTVYGQDVSAFDDGPNAHVQITEGTGYLGMHLKINAAFSGFDISMPTYNATDSAATLAVYVWNQNPELTLTGEALAQKRFDKLVDNAHNQVGFDAPLGAGDYFFVVKDTSGPVGVWIKESNRVSLGYMYDGTTELDCSFQMTVRFTEDVATPFLPADKAVYDGSGNGTVIPDDSLWYTHPVMPDTWSFTDGLGRKSVTYEEAGPLREGKTLAMFYWSWHDDLSYGGAVNTSELIAKYPEAKNDYNHPAWEGTGRYCFWNEPIFGFYRTSDAWVLRNQVELLADAGVDVVFNDNTNGSYIWKSAYTSMFENWIEAERGGVKSPKISFLLPFMASQDSLKQVNLLWDDLYSTGKYSELWYYLEDKPMLMAHKTNVPDDIRKALTWRAGQPQYLLSGNTDTGSWGWLHTYPQSPYYGNTIQRRAHTVEEMTVGVAMNHNYVVHELTAMNGEYIMGRSYTSTYPDRYEKEGDEATKWGYNFSEQFDYALENDPMVIFVTGWNEWHAWRQTTPYGGPNSLVDNALVDEFIDEYSRDIEPTKGPLKDYYYYLLVNYVRKYKGMNPPPTVSESKTIDLSAGSEQWKDVEPYYAAYAYNVADRDAEGYKGHYYTESSGRNDIIGAQVARDSDYLYFRCECASDITAPDGGLWMNLYVDTGDGQPGWESFEYVINKTAPNADTAVLERFTGNGYESEKVADCAYVLDGRYLTVKVAKSDIGISGEDYRVNFLWTDNVHDEGQQEVFSGDIMDFYISGDVAPGGRFTYSYVSESVKETETGNETGTENETNAEVDTDPEPESRTEIGPETETRSDWPESRDSVTESGSERETESTETGGCTSVLPGILTGIPVPALICACADVLKKKKSR